MNSLYLLVPLGLVLMAVAIGALVWASRNGQFDHLDNASRRLPDDD